MSQPLEFSVIDEQEPDGEGNVVDVTTIFLTASACPIGCTMCDLHHNMLAHRTPAGAITQQIKSALASRRTSDSSTKRRWIKLYNSGNFFDPASIPTDEYHAIAELCQPFSRVIIENHPRFGASRLKTFRDLLSCPLEIAVGLETVQPRWLSRLGKQMTRDQFDQYARFLKDHDVDLRVFLIVGVPGISVNESLRWARLSVRHALRQSARHISLIPARAGHGWSGQSDRLPKLTLADLQRLQKSAIQDATARNERVRNETYCTITIDTWNLDPANKSTS
ncbi:MAG: Fe-S oxidoreductase [Pirellulaceae bacterium]